MEVTTDFSQQIKDICLTYFRDGEKASVYELVNLLMDMEGLPMHCPPHHFIMPATLLTVCHKLQGSEEKVLIHDLGEAKVRASKVLGGFCGNYGSCGAAVGIGIFYSIFTHTTPLSTETWSRVNRATGKGLLKLAEIEGPRCCKRVTFLSIRAAVPAVKELLGVELGGDSPVKCSYFANSRECRKEACPFYPLKKESSVTD